MNGDRLDEKLRLLAGAGPRQAPDWVEARLRDAFRRDRRARRMRRSIMAAVAVGAAAAAFFGVLFFTRQPRQGAFAAMRPALRNATPRSLADARGSETLPELRRRVDAPLHKPRRKEPARYAATDFMPLPYGDDSLVNESATIVRMELPSSALRLAGFAAPEDRPDGRVQADVVVGPDGIAHAVRFVRQAE